MKTFPKVSIIVPVYNVDKYLIKCIESVLAQTFTDFELILIDDGSTDNSTNICDEFQIKDNRIKVFHKKNGGVSSARNTGLDKAKGECICFIDADDWVEVEFLRDLIKTSNSIVSDLHILTSVLYDFQDYRNIIKTPTYSKTEYSNNEIIKLLIETIFFTTGDGGCWSKLFNRNLINLDNQRFILNNAAYEDTLFTFQYLSKCDSVVVNKGAHYHYMHRNAESLSTTIHPYTNYLDSGKNGLKILDTLKNKYQLSVNNTFYTMGVTKFLNIVNYSIFSLYASPSTYTQEQRFSLLKTLLEVDKKYKQLYNPKNIKQKIINRILRFGIVKIADALFILLFKIAAKVK